ncbi:hypothetical protein PILCRDRAFT_816133 [Piloderma croceum F 1598]|uniref:Uncharacterized protein n=1 Tax=Piloderma croceum (strain F 1598) TaxID=765440 RepID=A0A0C3G6C8_PILCF|nr:hypothetical protein PILCRDRAFT_816133 [Piloderma croceum F 1598]
MNPLGTFPVKATAYDLCENNSQKRCLGTKVGKENRLSKQPKMEFEMGQLDVLGIHCLVISEGEIVRWMAYMRIGRRRTQRGWLSRR